MTKISKANVVAALLSFNGGFVDTAGFLGLAAAVIRIEETRPA
ncbi:MAG: hypothetical protein V4602_15225 [Pseudomonadota bacterium]